MNVPVLLQSVALLTVQCIHDIRVVCTPERTDREAVVHRDARGLGIALFEYLLAR